MAGLAAPSSSTNAPPDSQPSLGARTLSTGSLKRRQSAQERINEILETGRQRAESYGSPRLQPLLRSATAPAPISEDDDENNANGGDGDDHGVETRQPLRQQSLNYQTLQPDPEPRQRKLSGPRKASGEQHEQEAGAGTATAATTARRGKLEESRFRKFLRYFQSVELENKGSVARDHLALERTFLAWLRTSLAFASIGIAITQLFRLNTSLSGPGGNTDEHLRHLGRPLGTTFLGVSILILFLGYNRYLQGQYWVMRGKFPASRGTVMLVSFVAFAVTVASLVVVIAVQPPAGGA